MILIWIWFHSLIVLDRKSFDRNWDPYQQNNIIALEKFNVELAVGL